MTNGTIKYKQGETQSEPASAELIEVMRQNSAEMEKMLEEMATSKSPGSGSQAQTEG